MLTFGGRGTSTQVLLSMRALHSSHIACFQLGSRRAWKGDLGIGEEVVTCKLYLGLAFTILTLERVTIGYCEVGSGSGDGGVVGVVMVLIEELEVLIAELFVDLFVGLFVGLFVVVFVEKNWSHEAERKDSFVKCDMTRNDNFVGVQVKAPISMMIVRVPEKDRWCGTRGKFVRWKGLRITKASKHAKVIVRGWFVK
ncbi:hypothetical protein Tco_1462894 [Tanacetum coccineum]